MKLRFLYLCFQFLETLLANFLIIIMKNMFLDFSQIIDDRELQLIKQTRNAVHINRIWNAHKI